MKSRKKISITVTPYDGDQPFPEADRFAEYCADRIEFEYGSRASVECSYGARNDIRAYGFNDSETTEIESLSSELGTSFWNDFCSDGFKDYAE
jgi:hypothetical protein